MDYDAEISALKNTVLELLEVCERQSAQYKKIEKQYTAVKKEYKEVYGALMRKDDAYQEVAKLQQEQNERLLGQISKLNELEDVLEDMA